MKIGILGIGHLAAYLVQGAQKGGFPGTRRGDQGGRHALVDGVAEMFEGFFVELVDEGLAAHLHKLLRFHFNPASIAADIMAFLPGCSQLLHIVVLSLFQTLLPLR